VLVAPTSRAPLIQKVSDADIPTICAGYRPDQFDIPCLIHMAAEAGTKQIPAPSVGGPMSKLKLEHGVSRIRRAKLQSSIDQTVADDIERMAEWSNNETNYIVNEMLRFALTQEEDFQKYKASTATNTSRPVASPKMSPAKSDPSPTNTSTHA
jgi:hypothetical protein